MDYCKFICMYTLVILQVCTYVMGYIIFMAKVARALSCFKIVVAFYQ